MKKLIKNYTTDIPVMVNIRLSPEELREYRWMALEEGKSFSTYIRDILRSYAKHHKPAKAAHDSV